MMSKGSASSRWIGIAFLSNMFMFKVGLRSFEGMEFMLIDGLMFCRPLEPVFIPSAGFIPIATGFKKRLKADSEATCAKLP